MKKLMLFLIFLLIIFFSTNNIESNSIPEGYIFLGQSSYGDHFLSEDSIEWSIDGIYEVSILIISKKFKREIFEVYKISPKFMSQLSMFNCKRKEFKIIEEVYYDNTLSKIMTLKDIDDDWKKIENNNNVNSLIYDIICSIKL